MRYAKEGSFAQLRRLALRNLVRHRGRTGMTLLAIVAGVSSLMIASGFIEDLFHQLGEALIHSQTGHIQVGKAGYFSHGSRSPEKYLIADTRQDAVAIQTMPQVKQVMARMRFSALLSNGRADLAVAAEGIEPDREARLGTYVAMAQGRPLQDRDLFGVVLGAGVAQTLNLSPGDPVTLLVSTPDGALNSLDLEVTGTFRTFSKEFDARAVRLHLASAQQLLASAGANTLVVELKQTADTGPVLAALERLFAGRSFEVRSWMQLNDFYDKTVQLYRRQLGVLQFIILVMVALGVVNLVNMAVLERVGEFGTMRALGNRDWEVFVLVIAENAMLAVAGALLGVVVGALLALLISHIGIPMPPPPNADLGYTARIRLAPDMTAIAFAVGFIATLLAAVPPALRVSRMSVAEQLRYNV
jgi:putative ABC transport system permease protein